MKSQINIRISRFLIICFIVLNINGLAQEMGLNFNHNPEIIDFEYVKKTNVAWVRATPRILDYYRGQLSVDGDPALSKLQEAGVNGYKLIFGFRWDFKQHKMRIPAPNSPEEQELFALGKRILAQVGRHVDLFTLGNEPNLETMEEDMYPDSRGGIPLVRFMKRQYEMVVAPFFNDLEDCPFPQVFLGSLPALFEKKQQQIPAIPALIQMAQNNPKIDGLALHLHISNFDEVEASFEFARKIMPTKPIIVTEYSLHRLFLNHRSDPLGDSDNGVAFAKKYHRNTAMKIYEWCGIANRSGISQEEWQAMFESRNWYPKNYLKRYYDYFRKYGVLVATYPLFQQSCPENMTANSPMWFVNPIIGQKSLQKQPDGTFSPNPLNYNDFLELVEKGKKQ